MMDIIKRNKSLLIMLALLLMLVTGCTPSNDGKPANNADQISESSELEDEVKAGNAIVINGTLEVHYIDVDQGDAILIKQGDRNMLIDAGENHKGQVVVDYLRSVDVQTLDYVVGTHPHSDHIGGLDDVINSFEINAVILPDKIHTTKTFEDVLSAISSKSLKITNPKVGDVFELGEAKFTILAPNGSEYSNLNNYSVSVKLEYGNNSFVFTGDAEKQSEEEMIDNGIDLKADVLKAGHHGSNTSNTDSFVNKVDPDYVVIQVGEGNKYNHPDIDIVTKFENNGVQVFRTDIHGTVIATSDGNDITFTTHKGEMPPKTAKVDKPETTPTQALTEDVVESKVESPEQEIPKSTEYIGTKTSKTVHTSDCRHVPKEENRAYFDNFQQATNAGYKACKVCKPN